ncbi:MAG: response regulator transcription factor [Verrucomicrobiota bacterium]
MIPHTASDSPGGPAAVARKSSAKIRVYLADDDEQFSLVVHDLLCTQAGVDLIGSSGTIEKTLHDLAATPVEVLVLDLYMPQGETLECIPDLKRTVPEIKVLVVTGGGWNDQQVASILAGANGFLYKPFTSSDLAKAIQLVHSGKAYFDYAALAAALSSSGSHSTPSVHLSSEDREFLDLIRQGLTNTAIADQWKTGIKAVYQRRYRLKAKLGLHSARELAHFAASFEGPSLSGSPVTPNG